MKTCIFIFLFFATETVFSQQLTVITSLPEEAENKEVTETFRETLKQVWPNLVIRTNQIDCAFSDPVTNRKIFSDSFSQSDSSQPHVVFLIGGWEKRADIPDSIFFGSRTTKISLKYILNWLRFLPSRLLFCTFIVPDQSADPMPYFNSLPSDTSLTGRLILVAKTGERKKLDGLTDDVADCFDDANPGDRDLDLNKDFTADSNEWLAALIKSASDNGVVFTSFQFSVEKPIPFNGFKR